MRIRQLKLKNFRCFGKDETVVDFDDLTAFIGINSSGKTAALLALEKLFGGTSIKRELKRADFHVPKGTNPEDLLEQSLCIEAVIDFPELAGTEDDSVSRATVPDLMSHMTVSEPDGTPYVRFRLEGLWKRSRSPEGDVEQKYWFVTISETEEVPDPSQYLKPVEAQIRSLVEIIYVPAIRNPAAQLRNVSGTILGRVWRGINWPEDINENIRESGVTLEGILRQVAGFNVMQNAMNRQWASLHSDVRYNQVSLGFDTGDLDSVLQKLDVRFFPTEVPGSYSVDALGEGLQSLFYLSLVNSLLEIEAEVFKEKTKLQSSGDSKEPGARIFRPEFEPPALTILAIEEPENHIAPHLLGRVMGRLNQIATQSNAQVIVSSHSPAIVQRVDPESLRHFRICKDRLCTIVRSITLPSAEDEAYKFVKEAVRAYPEIYFAGLVVLGEGDTEEIIIPRTLRLLRRSLDESGISVVPLGGRFVNHFWRLLSGLDIPYVTLLDLDLGRETGGWARIKYAVNQLILNGCEKSHLSESLSMPLNEALDSMDSLPINREAIVAKARALENYDVFFAAPLDMDFTMLLAFENEYKSTAPVNGGPRIPDKSQEQDAFDKKMDDATKATLKSGYTVSHVYSDEEKEAMIWYVYLFLNRGKPSTHILALSDIDDVVFAHNLPSILETLLNRVEEKLQDDPFSQIPPESAVA